MLTKYILKIKPCYKKSIFHISISQSQRIKAMLSLLRLIDWKSDIGNRQVYITLEYI